MMDGDKNQQKLMADTDVKETPRHMSGFESRGRIL